MGGPGQETTGQRTSGSGNSQPASNAAAQSAADKDGGPVKLSFTSFTRKGTDESGIYYYPNELSSGTGQTDYVRFIFKQYTPPFKEKSQRGNQVGYNASINNLIDDPELKPIALYMPEDIQAQYATQWGARSIQNTTGSILQSASGFATGDIKGGLEAIGGMAIGEGLFIAAANKALDALQKTGQGEGLNTNDIFSSTAGVVINPNSELLFQGFDLRSFTLNFKLVAHNDKEAKDIKGIITRFKKAMLPTINSGTKQYNPEQTGDSNVDQTQNFIGVPSLVIVKFMQGGEENRYLTQFKPCAITSLNVNYTSDGAYATYYTGAPVAISLQLGFAETKLIYREDIYPDGPSF